MSEALLSGRCLQWQPPILISFKRSAPCPCSRFGLPITRPLKQAPAKPRAVAGWIQHRPGTRGVAIGPAAPPAAMDPAMDDLSLPVSMGTTIMAASFDGGVVMGADSRTSTGACEPPPPPPHTASPGAAPQSGQSTRLAFPPLSCPCRHCQPRDRQDHLADRQHLHLPLRLRSRHAEPVAIRRGGWVGAADEGYAAAQQRCVAHLSLAAEPMTAVQCIHRAPAAPFAPFAPCPRLPLPACPQWFLQQHGMELGDEPEVKTAAKLAQTMAYQNKNFLQVGWLGGWAASAARRAGCMAGAGGCLGVWHNLPCTALQAAPLPRAPTHRCRRG